jgi:hypothetical protein
MTSKRTIRQVAVALLLLAAFLFQGTWALAGVTGGLGGNVTDTNGKPVAGATVKVTSASEVSQRTTDSAGHFTFLSLAPDTYTVSIEKDGYAPFSEAGVSVFADNQLALTFQLQPQLKTIAKVSSTAAGSLVKSGVGSDIYNVNSAQIQASAALGGGANLNSAYSAIASVPGVSVPIGGAGWNQSVYVRGSQSFFTGYEYDGIPINRSFDNYNASTESSLGLQELQVYTGGGPSSNSSSGTSGFINQVIKTGTYPGYASVQGGLGDPTFYHQLQVEAGGASPDRNFSYYVGLSGYDQDYRFLNNQNGATGLGAIGGPYSGYSTATANQGWISGDYGLTGVPNFNRGDYALCNGAAETPASVTSLPSYQAAMNGWNQGAGLVGGWAANGPGGPYADLNMCLDPYSGAFGGYSQIDDRENVVNFHFAIPRKNGLRDDIQVLWSASMMKSFFYSSSNDAGGPLAAGSAITGADNASVTAYGLEPSYFDASGIYYGVPFGTPVAGLTASNYYFPDSPTDRALDSELPANYQDTMYNDTGIAKVSITHALSDASYLRLFGYTFFSDWNMTDPDTGFNDYEYGVGGPCDCSTAMNYILPAHTTGGELQFADQINDKNLLQFTANYTTATITRWNNETQFFAPSPIGYIADNNGVFSCYNPATGANLADAGGPGCAPDGPYQASGTPAATCGTAGQAACTSNEAALAGAQWDTLLDNGLYGSLNTVIPKFSVVTLSDEWRPSDKWLINASLRYENYTFDMPDSANEADEFYAQIFSQDVCVNAAGNPLSEPLPPGAAPPAPLQYTSTCPTGYSHPPFTAASPSSYALADISPRFSVTFTQNPDTVWRGSIGVFTEPPLSASVQYLNAGGNEASVWGAALPFGFDSPFHPIPLMTALQADGSLEKHIKGTDMSYKISPFMNYTTRYQEQAFIGPNFVTQAPVGDFRSYGVEAAFTKGDFSKDGLSGTVSLTYADAAVKFIGYLGENQLVQVAGVIQQYDKLTKQGGGAPCYTPYNINAGTPGTAVAAGACTASDVVNPYYNNSYINPYTINPSSWYPAANTGLSAVDNPEQDYYDGPLTGSMILNYRKNKFAITPSIQIAEGSSYGGPFDVNGLDPRMCAANQATDGVADPQTASYAGVATNCDYMSLQGLNADNASPELYIPNPQTGQFTSPGEYRNPWIMLANLQMSYDFSPRITGILTIANLWHDCFGGSKEPWTSAYPAGTNVCGYFPTSAYVSNFYNGSSPYDTAANGITPYAWQTNSYAPSTEAGGAGNELPSPLNVYFQIKVKI